MSHWHCSVDGPIVRQRQQKECERAQEGLSRVSSCFQQLVTSLGSSTDGYFLRDEIDKTRTLAHRLCIGTSTIRRSPVCLLPVGLSLVHLSVCRSVSASGSPAVRLWLLPLRFRGQTSVGASVGCLPVNIRELPVWPPEGLLPDWTVPPEATKW